MVERIIYALLYLCGLVLAYYAILYVLGALGIHIPPNILNVLMVMLVLVAVLILWRLFAGAASFPLWPRDPPATP